MHCKPHDMILVGFNLRISLDVALRLHLFCKTNKKLLHLDLQLEAWEDSHGPMRKTMDQAMFLPHEIMGSLFAAGRLDLLADYPAPWFLLVGLGMFPNIKC